MNLISTIFLFCMLIMHPLYAQAIESTTVLTSTLSSQSLASTRTIIVISDLHIGVGKVTTKGQWQNLEDFRWPDQFSKFLNRIAQDGNGKTDLIIDGDLFELWQSTTSDCQSERGLDFGCTEEEEVARLNKILKTHRTTLVKLGKFARKGDNRLIIIPGNHDAALLFPKVLKKTLNAINGGNRVVFASKGYWISDDKRIYIDHGHQIGRDVNRWENWPAPFITKNGKTYLKRPWGELFVQDYFNRLESNYPIIDNISSESKSFLYALSAEGKIKSITDVAGFLKFYFFGVSWGQFTGSVGKESAPHWDLDAIKQQGPQFIIDSLPEKNPVSDTTLFLPDLRNLSDAKVKTQLEEMMNGFKDEEIQTICDQRAFLFNQKVNITKCPTKDENLGGLIESTFRDRDKVIGEYLEQKVCPNLKGCFDNPFEVYVFGHTHDAFPARELSLSDAQWKPKIINSGAWQRVASPLQLEIIRQDRKLPEDQVLTKLRPEDLPPCYSFVIIEPYNKDRNPEPLLRYWVGQESMEGKIKEACTY